MKLWQKKWKVESETGWIKKTTHVEYHLRIKLELSNDERKALSHTEVHTFGAIEKEGGELVMCTKFYNNQNFELSHVNESRIEDYIEQMAGTALYFKREIEKVLQRPVTFESYLDGELISDSNTRVELDQNNPVDAAIGCIYMMIVAGASDSDSPEVQAAEQRIGGEFIETSEMLARASMKEVNAAIGNAVEAFSGVQEHVETTFRRCAETVGSTDHALEVLDTMVQVSCIKGSPSRAQMAFVMIFQDISGIDIDEFGQILERHCK